MNQYKFEKGFNVRRFLIISSVVLLISYGIFNARNLLIGPTIEIFSPLNNSETNSNVLEVKGLAKNISFISLNEKPIFITPDGFFDEKLLLSPGFNIIEVKAKDRFRQEEKEVIRVYYKQEETI